LSQNFLRRSGAETFLDLVDVETPALAIEVGAGEGILTEDLARLFDHVLAYEVDPHIARMLTDRVRRLPNVDVVVEDFLAAPEPDEPFQIIGNVPFSLTSPIVDWCLDSRWISSATIITQLEYAKKRTGGYGRWSLRTVLTWPYFDWELRGRIAREQFRPVPRVDAGVLHLAQRPEPLIPPQTFAAYRRLVELGFSGLGGSLYASLSRAHPPRQVAAAFEAAGLDRDTVVAFVTPWEWLDIFEALAVARPSGRPSSRSRRRASQGPGRRSWQN
jgi:23S rRNA (adenine-N6)-dimethyltransferase